MSELRVLVLDRSCFVSATHNPETKLTTYTAIFKPAEPQGIEWVKKLIDFASDDQLRYAEWGHPEISYLEGVTSKLKRLTTWSENRVGLQYRFVSVKEDGQCTVELTPMGATKLLVEELLTCQPSLPFLLGMRGKIHGNNDTEELVQVIGFDVIQSTKREIDPFYLKQLNPARSLRETEDLAPINQKGEYVYPATETPVKFNNPLSSGYSPEQEMFVNETPFTQTPLEVNFNPTVQQEDIMSSITTNTIHVPYGKEQLKDVKKVLTINGAAGNRPVPREQVEKEIMRQTKIDLSECLELLHAVATSDIPELRNALADKRVTLNGFASFTPFSLSSDFDHTVVKLFTRFDNTEDDALLTQQKYAALGVTTVIEKNFVIPDDVDPNTPIEAIPYYVNKVAEDCTGSDGQFYPQGKFLKSINYHDDLIQDPSLDDLISKTPESIAERWNIIRTMLLDFVEQTDKQVFGTGE